MYDATKEAILVKFKEILAKYRELKHTIAAAEAAIGLAILVVYFRNRGSIAVDEINSMKG